MRYSIVLLAIVFVAGLMVGSGINSVYNKPRYVTVTVPKIIYKQIIKNETKIIKNETSIPKECMNFTTMYNHPECEKYWSMNLIFEYQYNNRDIEESNPVARFAGCRLINNRQRCTIEFNTSDAILSMYLARSGSMLPLIAGRSLILYQLFDGNANVGDIVCYSNEKIFAKYKWLGRFSFVCHRIIGIKNIEGKTCYVIKGDNNSMKDGCVPKRDVRFKILAVLD